MAALRCSDYCPQTDASLRVCQNYSDAGSSSTSTRRSKVNVLNIRRNHRTSSSLISLAERNREKTSFGVYRFCLRGNLHQPES